MNKKLLVASVISAIFFFAPFNLNASSTPKGPEGKTFGAGIILGEPTGVSFKGFVTKQIAIDLDASWSFVDDAFMLVSDGLYEFFDIPVKSTKFTLPFYAGGGLKLGFDRGGKDDGKTIVGLRVPVGVAVQFEKYPVEIFVEIAPGIEVAPSTKPDVTGGVGARFYF